MRYIIKNPTDVYGHYSITFRNKLDEAIKETIEGGFVLDTFQKHGEFSYKRVFEK